MEACIPLFTSHYSIGKSILTFDAPDTVKETGADSIIKICKDYNITDCVTVEDNMSGFVEAFKETKAAGISFCFGLKLMVCDNIADKSDTSFKSEHKIVIFAKSQEGYKDLMRIYSLAATEGFYYIPRIDFQNLRRLWTNNLDLFIPFYDSYIHKSATAFSTIVPFFDFAKPKLFIENNLLPVDQIIAKEVQRVAATSDYKLYHAKTIYYKLRKDFEAYMVYRTIFRRTTLDNPNIRHFASPEFCIEAWKETLL